MTRALPGSKRRPAKVSRCARVAFVAALLAAAGCRGDGSSRRISTLPDASSAVSRDGVLQLQVPVDLLVHRLDQGLLATSADGGFRLYLQHAQDDKLIRAVGAAKEILNLRGWDFATEQHFERAAVLTMEMRKRPRDPPTELRTMWFLRRGGRVVICDAVAVAAEADRLGASLKALCQRAVVTFVEEEAQAAADAQP